MSDDLILAVSKLLQQAEEQITNGQSPLEKIKECRSLLDDAFKLKLVLKALKH